MTATPSQKLEHLGMASENGFLNVPDAAVLLGVHIQTLRRLARQKKIPAFKVGRDWRFHREALIRWVEEQQLGAGPAPVPNADDKIDGSADPQRSAGRNLAQGVDPANASSVGHWLDGRHVLVVTGRSVLPAELSPSGGSEALILEVALDSATDRVLTIASDGLPKLGQQMLSRLLVGKTLPVALGAAKDGLVNGYYSDLRTPVIAALQDLLENYRELSRRRSSADARDTCSVLIVDDDEELCRALCRMVEGLGCSAKIATRGARGLDLVGSDTPDLILLDLVMPEMNGPQFLKELRKLHPELPVVIITADPDGEQIKAAALHAPVMLLAKPIEPKLLERTVRTVIGDRRILSSRR